MRINCRCILSTLSPKTFLRSATIILIYMVLTQLSTLHSCHSTLSFIFRDLDQWSKLVMCSLAGSLSFSPVLTNPDEMDWGQQGAGGRNIILCLLHNTSIPTILVPSCWKAFVGSFGISFHQIYYVFV